MHVLRSIIILLIFFQTYSIISSPTIGKTFFQQRSQGMHDMLHMAGKSRLEYTRDYPYFSGFHSPTAAFYKSLSPAKLSEYLFFNGTNTLQFGPLGDPDTEIFSRNFFLNDDFRGQATIKPTVENFLFDIYFQFEFDHIIENLYLTLDFPLVWSEWDIGLEQMISTSGKTIAANALGNPEAKSSPLRSILSGWKGATINQGLFPDLTQIMNFATIDGKQTRGSLADFHCALGYFWARNECYHFSTEARLVIPTGTRPEGEFFFEPIIGNGRHTELGLGLNGHYQLYNWHHYHILGIYFDLGLYYMFKATQRRTFDLKNNGIGSRYLLFKKFDSQGVYANEILFGPNVTTLKCRTHSPFQTQGTLLFDYQRCNLTFDIGYSLWFRTKETLTLSEKIDPNTFGIQGNTPTAGANKDTTASQTRIDGTNANTFDPTPVFISTQDIDINSAIHPKALSHTIFGYLGYIWEEHPYTPFIGFGLLGEFSGIANNALEQWAIWATSGFTFS